MVEMRIAIAGWYFLDDFYASLWRVHEKYPVFIVAHRENNALANFDLPFIITPNEGLEWGAYNDYLMRIWSGDNVLFCHDDMEFVPVLSADYTIPQSESVFNRLADIPYDHAYVFQDRKEDVINCGKHGRMVYMSERLLKLIRSEGGFPYGKEGEDYNQGITATHAKLEEIQARHPEWSLLQKVYFPNINMGYRGEFGKGKEREIKRLSVEI